MRIHALQKWTRSRGVFPACAALLGLAVACSSFALGPLNVLERGYNRFRTGANTAETILTPANVRSSANQFHKRFVMPVDGKIEGSPLYASGVTIAGGRHNVVYVATMHNTVYAFDADTPGNPLSSRWLGTPVTGNDMQALTPATIHTEWGIASTPVIDASTGTLYVVRWGYENGISGPTFRLFGLDMTNLSNDKFGSVLIDGYNVGGTRFNRYLQIQRAGLVSATKPSGAKALVISFGGGEGQGSPSGWVVAFDTSKLAQGSAVANVWCSNPNNDAGTGYGAGVWMSNAAPAVDDNGDIYVVTGNGPYNPRSAADQLGESVVRLTWNPGNPGSLTASDWFTPFLDIERDYAHKGQDLGAGGVIALPDETGLIVGGKDGVCYHVNRLHMGKRDFTKLLDNPFVASFDYQPWNGHTSLFDDLNQITSTDPFTIGHADRGRSPHLHGTGIYFNKLLFEQGENNAVHVFSKNGAHFGATPIARGRATASWGTSSPGGMPGGMLSLSANGTSNAILWANEAFGNIPSDPDSNNNATPNIIRAYDISTVGTGTLESIWDSETDPNDHVGASTKFAPPLVANGRVYQATYDNQVVVYGLGAPSPTPTRDIRRTVVFIYGETVLGQDMFVRGGAKGGAPIRIRHRNWLNEHTNSYRWNDAYLDWSGGEFGQRQPFGGFGGGSPVDWTTSLAQGQNQPYVSTAGYGITVENNFGMYYWMLDVDMDCEQAFDDGQGRKWFELKAFIAPTPGWERNITQTSNPMPPYSSINHMGMCGVVNVFVANFPNRPAALDPNSARFFKPSYTYLSPVDERGVSNEVLNNTPCISPGIEKRCLANIAQTCQAVDGGKFFRTTQECNATSVGGNYVQMCQKSVGQCSTPAALVKLESVAVDGRPLGTGAAARYPSNRQRVVFNFIGLSLTVPGRVRYRYMLDGYDRDWSQPTETREATYTSLPPARYTFRVMASNSEGLWNGAPASVSFDVEPQLVETWWFRVIELCVAAAAIFAAFRYRMARVHASMNLRFEERLAERSRIARELHDTLLQSVQASLVQMVVARTLISRQPVKAEGKLDQAIGITEGAIAEGRDAIQDLRSQPPVHTNLAKLLTLTGQELASSRDTNERPALFRVKVQGQQRDIKPLIQDEAYRIARELLRNAFQHANASVIDAEIRYEDRLFRLRVRDDGKGIDLETFKEGARAGHWGLPGMRERAKRIGGQLEIWSKAGAGTEVELSIPGSIAYEAARDARWLFLRFIGKKRNGGR